MKKYVEPLLKSCHRNVRAKEQGSLGTFLRSLSVGMVLVPWGSLLGCLTLSLFADVAGPPALGRDRPVGGGCSQLSLGSSMLVFFTVLMTRSGGRAH